MAAGELTRRWAVALVGVPIVVGALYLGSWPLAALVAVMAALGAGEAYRLARQKGVRPLEWVGVAAAAGFVGLAYLGGSGAAFAGPALALVAALILASLVGVTFARGPEREPLAAAGATVLGALYAGLSLAVVPLLHGLAADLGWAGVDATPWAGVAVVALPLAATWIGDACAFFAGSAWGRHRMAPTISPKKSWEGAVAGVGGAALAGALWFRIVEDVIPRVPLEGMAEAAAVGGVLGVAAIVGDLVESVLKRDAGVKDSGTIFPGHGGVLDRLDALVFSLPVAYGLLLGLELGR